jgi:hypothetical protein
LILSALYMIYTHAERNPTTKDRIAIIKIIACYL